MSESRVLLVDTASRIFADLDSSPRDFDVAYGFIEEAGFPSLLVREHEGGFGGNWLDAVAVMRLAGYHAVALPVSEAILARYIGSVTGLSLNAGYVGIASQVYGKLEGGRFTGKLTGVAWGRHADAVVGQLAGQAIVLHSVDADRVIESQSPGGDPRDELVFTTAAAESSPCAVELFALGALSRTALIAGALDSALGRSIDYANERVQFGRNIGKFQAVQQSLALFAEEAAATNCALQAAACAAQCGEARFEVAAAKLRASMAAGTGAAIAHQVHGAIGFTQTHSLHRWTRRLIAWASEFGSERHWATILGCDVARRGADALWPDLAARSDRIALASRVEGNK